MKKSLAIVLLALFSLSALAQNEFRAVNGRIKDALTGQILAYTSVTLEGTSISNISNSEGVFSLKMPVDTPDNAVIVLSRLGYSVRRVTVGSFGNSSSDNPYQITMTPVSLELEAAVIKSIDPEILLMTAYSRVRENYPRERVGLTTFYRELIRKASGKYLVMNEAVVDVDMASYTGISADRAAIYKGRGSQNYDVSDTLMVNFQGGIMNALNLDVVKTPFIGVALQEVKDAYNLTMEPSASIDDKMFAVIGFDQKHTIEDVLFHGKIYVDPDSYAIARIEFSMNLEGHEEEGASVFVVKGPNDRKFYAEKADYVINYKKYDGLWYFDYSRTELTIATRKRRALFRQTYEIMSEMAVTDHKKGEFKIGNDERVKFSDILSRTVQDFEDEDFWEDYNVIEPDATIDNIIRRIIRQLRRRE